MTAGVWVAHPVMSSVAVVDAAICNATNTPGCADGPVASVATSNGPLDLAEDADSQTLYVTNIADNTVSVIDGRLCNARPPRPWPLWRCSCGRPTSPHLRLLAWRSATTRAGVVVGYRDAIGIPSNPIGYWELR